MAEICRIAQLLEAAGADWLHVDVMDGAFVSPKTFGIESLRAIRGSVKLPLDIHLMVKNPQQVIEDYIKYGRAGGKEMRVVIHPTAAKPQEINACLQFLAAEGITGGLALDIDEDIDWIDNFSAQITQILVMTVKAGAGGQAFRPEMLEKVKKIKQKWSDKMVIIDGGINDKTISYAAKSKVDGVVAGSYVVGAENYAEAIDLLRRGG